MYAIRFAFAMIKYVLLTMISQKISFYFSSPYQIDFLSDLIFNEFLLDFELYKIEIVDLYFSTAILHYTWNALKFQKPYFLQV